MSRLATRAFGTMGRRLVRDRLWLVPGLSALTILAGCAAHLPTQSFLGAGTPSPGYRSFAVYAAFKDLSAEATYERVICRTLRRAGAHCAAMVDIAPPTQSQDAQSREKAAARSGAGAVIVVELADPKPASRRILDDGRPGYRVSLIDSAHARVVSRFTMDGQAGAHRLGMRARALASTLRTTLETHGIIRSADH